MTSQDLDDARPTSLQSAWMLVLAVVLVYANALLASFQFDDFNVIVQAPGVHGLAAWWRAPLGIRPLLKATYALNWSLSSAPWGFHLANILIHLATALLLLRLARLLLGPGLGALMAALAFALHPVQTEAVAYICARSVALSSCFALLALLLHDRAQGKGGRAFEAASCLAFAAALLTRETALVLPAGLLLWDWLRGRTLVAALRAARAHWLLAALALLVPLLHGGYGSFFHQALALRTVPQQLANLPQILSYLGTRVFLLGPLNVDPDLHPQGFSAGVWMGLLGLFAGLGLTMWNLRRRRFWAFGLLWAFLFLLPTCSFIPRQDLVAERHLYLPMAGVALAFGALIQAYYPLRPRWVAGLACALLVAMGLLTVRRNRDYRTEITLWEDTVRKSPQKARPHNNLGYAYQEAGRREEARVEYQRALALDPGSLRAQANLALLDAPTP